MMKKGIFLMRRETAKEKMNRRHRGWLWQKGLFGLLLAGLLLSLTGGIVHAAQTKVAAVSEPIMSSAAAPSALMQFSAGGHVLGFAPTQVVLASLDHALRVEFVGTAGVTPVTSGAQTASSSDGQMMGKAQPLGVVTYPDVWRGVSLDYRASEGGIAESTYTIAPGADSSQIRWRYNVPVEVPGDGSLQFRFGRGTMSESAPIAWQEIDGARVGVEVAFQTYKVSDTEVQVGFRLGAYNPALSADD